MREVAVGAEVSGRLGAVDLDDLRHTIDDGEHEPDVAERLPVHEG